MSDNSLERIGVCMVTYNQEKFISQAIESVLMQKCTLPVILYIGQDCSTDDTKTICEKYASDNPNRVVLINNTHNLGLVGNTLSLLELIRKDGCKYVAMLDGDDYWCDEHKLQKQVSFMLSHPECGLVHTCVDELREGKIHPDKRDAEMFGHVFDRIESYQIGNCTVLFKTELLNMIDFEQFQNQGFKSCDYVMYAIFASKAPFAFLPIHTAVWRRGHESVSNKHDVEQQISYVNNDLLMWKYLANMFPNRWSYTEESASSYFHIRSFHIAFRLGDRHRCLREFELVPQKDRKGIYFKHCIAYSRLLMYLWRKYKHY